MSGDVNVRIVKNRFGEIAQRIPNTYNAIARAAARDIRDAAKAATPRANTRHAIPGLKASITIDSTEENKGTHKGGQWWVYTPNWYAHLVEYGAAQGGGAAARPFMTPAAEQVRPQYLAACRRLEDHLR